MSSDREERPRDERADDGEEQGPSAGRETEGRGGGDRPRTDRSEDRPATHAADASLHSDALPDSVRCPHCGETDSEQFSAFGSAVSVSQYYCRSCRTVFEAFKWR